MRLPSTLLTLAALLATPVAPYAQQTGRTHDQIVAENGGDYLPIAEVRQILSGSERVTVPVDRCVAALHAVSLVGLKTGMAQEELTALVTGERKMAIASVFVRLNEEQGIGQTEAANAAAEAILEFREFYIERLGRRLNDGENPMADDTLVQSDLTFCQALATQLTF